MALDFPNSPSNGQQFNPAGSNTVWQYDGTKWLPIGKSIMPMGVTDGSNAAAGQVGEYRSSIIPSASPVSVTSGTWTQVTSLALPAGDWDFEGYVGFAGTASGVSAFAGAVSPTVTPAQPADNVSMNFTTGGSTVLPTGTARLSVSATTTVYLVGLANYTTGAATAYGLLRARRVR